MARHGQTILDGDGHLIESDREIFEYLEGRYRGKSPLLHFSFFPTLDGWHRGVIVTRLGIHKEYPDAQAWLRFLDDVGIQSTVLYPTAGLSHGLIQDPDWAVALARAYNDWLHDRYYRVDRRLRGVALVPLQDVGEAVKELRRAITELHMVGAVLPANGGDVGVRKPLGHPDFWPVYEEAERLNCPIAIHGAPSQGIGIDFYTRFAQTQSMEHPLAQMIQLTSMVYDGVFERFPRLRVAFLEAGAGWVPYMMDRLDRSYEAWVGAEYKEFGEWVKRRPSEYIASGRIFFSCEGSEESLGYAIQRIGDQVLLYASDFPHETNAERAKHELVELLEREDLSEQTKTNILCDNIQRFYQR
jgi:predicted TIM-barrel fold metal-dependent hydrolase